MEKQVRIIPAISDSRYSTRVDKKRVCAYCRVSTDSRKQHQSYLAQAEYYETYITNNPMWIFKGIYADEASGTKITQREGFHSLIEECKKKNIDLILTKSITRFARNTVDSIQTIRLLRSLGVGVFFEKENINTLHEESELMLTIWSSVAQLESEGISTNLRWGIQKRYKDGSYNISCLPYGYQKDTEKNIQINPEEGAVVRRIFEDYLKGYGMSNITKRLDEDQILPSRSEKGWPERTIQGILQNPFYKGDLILQKTYRTNAFPYDRKKNRGEKAKYLIQENHEPIVTEEEFERVQRLLEIRREQQKCIEIDKYRNRYLFTNLITCRNCGDTLKRKKIASGQVNERVQWCCKTHLRSMELCESIGVREEVLKQKFLMMCNKLQDHSDKILLPLIQLLQMYKQSRVESVQLQQIENRIEQRLKQRQLLMQIMQQEDMDSAIFIEKHHTLALELEGLKREKNSLLQESDTEKRMNETKSIMKRLSKCVKPISEFDEELLQDLVKRIYLETDGRVTFVLKNELELTE